MTRTAESPPRPAVSARPWSSRALESLESTGVGPIALAAAAAALLGVAMFGLLLAEGLVEQVGRGEVPSISVRAPVIAMVLIGMLPGFQLHLARGTRRSVDAIVRRLGAERLPGRIASEYPSRSAGLVGVATFLFCFVISLVDLSDFGVLGNWTPMRVAPWAFVAVLGWLSARLVHSIVVDAISVSRMASSLPNVDLLDSASLAPFVQQGLRGSLLLVGMMAISSVLAVAPGPAVIGSALVSGVTLAAAGAGFLLPLRGVRARIRAEKHAQLGALRLEIDSARRSVLAGTPDKNDVALRLPGLLALEARLEAVREWPLDTSSLARFGLYIALGVGSWIGAAGVERLLDRVLS